MERVVSTKRESDTADALDQAQSDAVRASESGLSRRDFLCRTGQLGLSLSLFGPSHRNLVDATIVDAATAPPSSTDAALRSSAALAAGMLTGFRWRMLGPFRGGRVAAATGVPGRPNEFYFGAVNGGVWKSIDAGRVWAPVFDSQPVASIGAIAVAPSAPDTSCTWAAVSRHCATPPASATACTSRPMPGSSWTHIRARRNAAHREDRRGSTQSRTFYSSPRSASCTRRNAERGVFRSRDGGKSWEKVLYKGPDIGAVEVVIDPTNSQVVYAGLWNTRRPPWFTYSPTNGPGGGIYKSTRWRHDVGAAQRRIADERASAEPASRSRRAIHGASTRWWIVFCRRTRRRARCTSPAAGGTTDKQVPRQGGVFRSDDAGATWTRLSSDTALWGRGWYFCKLAVDPKDADTVYVSNVSVSRTMRWREALGRAARIAGRRRLSSAVGLARRPEHDDRRERSGRDHHAQCEGRRESGDVELVAQSAHGADVPHLRRLSHAVLGDRRAAGLRRGRGALARQVRRDLDARLGADRTRGRERIHSG